MKVFRRHFAAILAGVLILAVASPALCGSITVRAGVKKKSKVNMTSFKVRTSSQYAKVNAPAGWTAKKTGKKTWIVSGGEIGPGGSVSVEITNSGTAKGRIVGADYETADGRKKWVGICADPIGWAVIDGGENGTDYLGYYIPPNEWGYFYQMFNTFSFPAQTLTCNINIDAAAQPYNFQILPHTFESNPVVDGFDLQDLIVPISLPDTTTEWEYQEYMEWEDATGNPGIPTDWVYDGIGTATMVFMPSDPSMGLGAGMTGPIVAYTSQLPPGFTEIENVESTDDDPLFGCPKDFIPVPMPSTMAAPTIATPDFHQLDWYDPVSDTLVEENTMWGRVDVSYTADTMTTWYLTMNASLLPNEPGIRILDNLPLFYSTDHSTTTNLQRDEAIFFDLEPLGVAPGMDVPEIYYSYSINYLAGPYTIDPGPTGSTPASVANLVQKAGHDAKPDTSPCTPPPAPANPTPNSGPAKQRSKTRDVRAVQEGTSKCMAGSFARSIDWLNRKYKLGMTKTAQQIYDDMIAAGVSQPGTGTPASIVATWIDKKNKYAKGKNIVTKVWDGGASSGGNYVGAVPGVKETSGDFLTWLKKEMKTEDVEVAFYFTGGAHIVTAVEIYTKDGKTYLKYRDDEHQNDNSKGDTKVKQVEITKVGNTYRFGSTGKIIYMGVSESVVPPKPKATPAPSLGCMVTWDVPGNYRIEISESPGFETLLDSIPVSAYQLEYEYLYEEPILDYPRLFLRMNRVIQTPDWE